MATYSTTTRATLRQRLRERLLPSFWTDAELNDLINEGLRFWNVLTATNKSSTTGSYSFSSNLLTTSSVSSTLLAILRVKNSATRPLDQVNLPEVGMFSPTWRTSSTNAVDSWGPLGLNNFFVVPSGATSTLTVEYVAKVTALTSDSDYVQLNESDMSALVDFMEFASSLKEGGEELTSSMPLLQSFLGKAASYNAKVANHAAFAKLLGVQGGGQEESRPTSQQSETIR